MNLQISRLFAGRAEVQSNNLQTHIRAEPEKPQFSLLNARIRASFQAWFIAFKQIMPLYVAIHMGLLILDCMAPLFTQSDFQWGTFPIHGLWDIFAQWDGGHYAYLAVHGYTDEHRTAFFPLYPFLSNLILRTHIIHNPFLAGALVSNIAWLIVFVVFYRLVLEDFDQELAHRTVLYHTLFPTAFFLAVGYNESLLLCMVLLSFYHMRHGNWWLAGIFGFFACLTRLTGILLIVPFAYEYWRQKGFNLKKAFHPAILSIALLPAALFLYMFYCHMLFGDWLSFIHVQSQWGHHFEMPWYGIVQSIKAIHRAGILSFQGLRNLTDLLPDLFVLALLIGGFIGPWRLPRAYWSYLLFGVATFIVFQLSPVYQDYPLQSMGRYMLEVFPAFIIAAKIGRNRFFHLNYLIIVGTLLFFLTTQYLTKHWIL